MPDDEWPDDLDALLGADAAERVKHARHVIDDAYVKTGGRPSPEVEAARHAIDREYAKALIHVREHSEETRERTARTNRTVIVLAVSIVLVLVVGAIVGSFLVVRNQDLQNIEDDIRANQNQIQVSQMHLCPLLDVQAHSRDKEIADAAQTAARARRCPGHR